LIRFYLSFRCTVCAVFLPFFTPFSTVHFAPNFAVHFAPFYALCCPKPARKANAGQHSVHTRWPKSFTATYCWFNVRWAR
jgi:hypothetical protein